MATTGPTYTGILWSPSTRLCESALLTSYANWLGKTRGHRFDSYDALWRWSTAEVEDFWLSLWEFFDVQASTPYDRVLEGTGVPGARWFPGSTLNYAEHALRNDPNAPAIIQLAENKAPVETSWSDLRGQVGALAHWLTAHGVQVGDRVVGYVPSIAESVVAFLACASIGAVWSACSQEYSSHGAADRFEQLDPVVLIVADGYRYAGREHRRHQEIAELSGLLSTVRRVLWIDNLAHDQELPIDAHRYSEVVATAREPEYTAVPFDHPLWVLYSSGTTGRPKGIVHGHGGILLEHLKYLGLHSNLKPGSRFFWFSTTSWMMWNIQVSGLLHGSTIFLYDGSPTWPHSGALWELAADHDVDFLGTSAAYLLASQKADVDLKAGFDLSRLTSLGSTGSPLPASCAAWLCENLPEVWLCAGSGGTDVASGFCGAVPTLPLRADEMQARLLGVAMASWDAAGHPLIGEVGELVVTKPMPSMPLFFWGDEDGVRYRDSYFSTYPGVWRHGDWVTVTSHGGVQVHGRSDATMNKYGVRMGSAEIYETVDQFPVVSDSLVVGVEQPDGSYWMPLFITVNGEIDGTLASRIKQQIRTAVSPRHVPDEVVVAPVLPRTLTGKRLEVPVKRILQGIDVEQAANAASVDNPAALHWFATLAEERRSDRGGPGSSSGWSPRCAELPARASSSAEDAE